MNNSISQTGGEGDKTTAAFVATFENSILPSGDGWAQLAPFGDFPGEAVVEHPQGAVRRFPAIQRMDREAAAQMARNFRSPWGRLKRYFTGCPIFAGHPDLPGATARNGDVSAKGMIVDLEVRDDGLYCKPVFTAEGGALVENKTYRAFSGHWTATEIANDSGAANAIKIFRPERLKSAGLTNHPNLPVHCLNEKSTTKKEIVNKQIIIQFLAGQGISLANEAADSEISSALETLATRLTTAETTLAASTLRMESVQAELANERRFHSDALLDAAIARGTITPAQKPEWTARFEADFANTEQALAAQTPVVKTRALTANAAIRRMETGSVSGRRQAVDSLVRAEMISNGGDYDRAFAAVQRANPALFESMKQPGGADSN